MEKAARAQKFYRLKHLDLRISFRPFCLFLSLNGCSRIRGGDRFTLRLRYLRVSHEETNAGPRNSFRSYWL